MIVYAICLVAGLVFTLCSLVMSHFFGGHDGGGHDIGTGGHAGAGFDDSGVPGISIFSPTVLAASVTAFGAFGLVFSKIQATSSVWVSAPLAATGGVAVAALTFWLLNSMFEKTQSSSEVRLGDLVGHTASVITPIPAMGVGEIAYVDGSSRYTGPARAEKGVAISTAQPVRITRVVGTQFYVEAIE